MPGQEGVPSVFSPTARTLDDLFYFTRTVIGIKPWEYDYFVHPLEWRPYTEQQFSEKKRLRVGILRTDGVVDPSPACARALKITEQALAREGHEIVEINPPDMYHALRLGSVLLNADGCRTFKSFMRSGEWWDQTDIDFIICPPNATPAVPHDGMKDAVSSCGYTFLWNIVSPVSCRRLQRLMKRCWLRLIDY